MAKRKKYLIYLQTKLQSSDWSTTPIGVLHFLTLIYNSPFLNFCYGSKFVVERLCAFFMQRPDVILLKLLSNKKPIIEKKRS
jgi:hypothetical protein